MPNALLVAGAGKQSGTTLRSVAAMVPVETRRIGHGGTLRAYSAMTDRLKQPQDGAPAGRAKLASIAAHLSDVLQEAEDARLTGGTRSLTRRLLGLNVLSRSRKAPAMVSGPISHAKVA